jgi:sterol desaturase/sphingolipid hydroxylase (fatty acid hydroxylase superfamily)
MKLSRSTVGYGLLAGGFMLWLAWAERRRPLRPRVECELDRTARNLALAGSSLLISQTVEGAVTPGLFELAEEHQLGLLRLLPLPSRLRQVVGFLVLDYTLYGWHWLNHRIPLLWRGHVVHHVDLDMDTSTGIRFHFFELTMTMALRFVQIVVLGVDREAFLVWNRTLLLAVVFQHSNLRLPDQLEQWLGQLLVTPQAHAVHHSQDTLECESNFSSMLILWDRLHGTHRPQPLGGIIGVAAYPEPVNLGECLALPFGTIEN